MTQIALDITMSLDGYVAGPNQTLEDPLGENGMQLHEWVFGLASWRGAHGMEGGERNADDDLMARSLEPVGAQVMGRRMYSGGSGPWEDDPNADGWWGEEPPFKVPVFVVTHHPRERREFPNGSSFTFVQGVEDAISMARDAASGRDVRIAGGGSIASQSLAAGLVDRIDLHVAPLLLGGGARLFDDVGYRKLELVSTSGSGAVSHLSYRVS